MRIELEVKPGMWIKSAKPNEEGDYIVHICDQDRVDILHFTPAYGWNTYADAHANAFADERVDGWMLPPAYEPERAI